MTETEYVGRVVRMAVPNPPEQGEESAIEVQMVVSFSVTPKEAVDIATFLGATLKIPKGENDVYHAEERNAGPPEDGA